MQKGEPNTTSETDQKIQKLEDTYTTENAQKTELKETHSGSDSTYRKQNSGNKQRKRFKTNASDTGDGKEEQTPQEPRKRLTLQPRGALCNDPRAHSGAQK